MVGEFYGGNAAEISISLARFGFVSKSWEEDSFRFNT